MILNKAKILPSLRKATKLALRQTTNYPTVSLYVQNKPVFLFSSAKAEKM